MNGKPAAEERARSQEWEHPRPPSVYMNRIVSCAVAWFCEWMQRNGLFTIGLFIPLAIVYGPAFKAHIERSMNPLVFNDDARQLIFPLFRYYDRGLFSHDYFATYYLASFPIGYRALYRIGAVLWDPAAISKVLTYILLAVTAIAVAAAARRLAGYFGSFLAVALVLGGGIFVFTMVGGMPRGFGFPVLALTAAALVYGKPRLLATIVCVSAAFYPPVAIQAGIALTIWLFALPGQDRGGAVDWGFWRRVRLVVVVASISALILLPELLGTRAYGRLLGPRDVTEYPERGERYQAGQDLPPFRTFPEATLQWVHDLFWVTGQPLCKKVREWAKVRSYPDANSNGDVVIELLTGALLIGGMLVAARDSMGRRLLVLGVAAWLSHLLARALTPSLYGAERYVRYAVPILLVLLIPTVGAAIGAQIFGRRFINFGRATGVIGIAAMALLPLAGRGPSKDFGLNIDVTSQHRFYDFLKQLPKDVLIASWPDRFQGTPDLDNVPYVSRRQVFIALKLNHSYQKGYAEEMRRRMHALIEAYFATDRGPLERLRDDFGVTHLIFQQNILEKPPDYFKPFTEWIHKAFNDGRSKGFEIPRQIEATKVFSDGPLIVLDLRRLSAQ